MFSSPRDVFTVTSLEITSRNRPKPKGSGIKYESGGQASVPGITARMAGLQDSWPRILVERQNGAHVGSSYGHLHDQVKQSRIAMSHAILVQKVLHDLATGRLVSDTQGLVFDVRSQAIGIDLDGGLQQELQV